METRRHLRDANEEQLKTLISQAYPPVESPPGVREEILGRLLAEFEPISRRRSSGIVAVWQRAIGTRPLWVRVALVGSLLLLLSLVAYSVPLPWKAIEEGLPLLVDSGSVELLCRGVLGQEVSRTVRAGDEVVLAGECSIVPIEGQDVAINIARGPQIHLGSDSLLGVVSWGAEGEERTLLLRLQKGKMDYMGDSRTQTLIEMPGVRVSASDAEFRALVTESNHVDLASGKSDLDVEVGDRSLVVREWEEMSTSLAPEEMVRPQRPIVAGSGGSVLTKERAFLVQGRAQPGSRVAVYSSDGRDGDAVADVQGLFEYEFLPLEEKSYEIWTVSTGPRGTSSTESEHIYLEFDWTPPMLVVDSPYWPDVTSSPVLLEGTTEPGARLVVNGMQVDVGVQGRFSIEIPLQPGNNDVVLKVSDAAGNEFVARMVVKLH